jgi:DNA-binding protein YbaB
VVDSPPSDFSAALAQARQLLDNLRSEGAGAEPGDSEPASGNGQALDGLIQVTARAGRVTEIQLDPRAMRLPSQTLAEELLAATNAALADLESKAAAQDAITFDPQALSARLAEVQDMSVRQMERYTTSISDVLARLEGRG